jgi:hypothetical protein
MGHNIIMPQIDENYSKTEAILEIEHGLKLSGQDVLQIGHTYDISCQFSARLNPLL